MLVDVGRFLVCRFAGSPIIEVKIRFVLIHLKESGAESNT
jgi:hypothetical protein